MMGVFDVFEFRRACSRSPHSIVVRLSACPASISAADDDAMEMVFDVSIMACEAAVDYCYYTSEEVDSTTRVP